MLQLCRVRSAGDDLVATNGLSRLASIHYTNAVSCRCACSFGGGQFSWLGANLSLPMSPSPCSIRGKVIKNVGVDVHYGRSLACLPGNLNCSQPGFHAVQFSLIARTREKDKPFPLPAWRYKLLGNPGRPLWSRFRHWTNSIFHYPTRTGVGGFVMIEA